MSAAPADLPATAGETTAARPWPVRLLAHKIGAYVDKMSPLWVEGQLVQISRRPGAYTAFLTLRDADVDMSMSVSVPAYTLDAMAVPPREGARVVVHGKATFWAKRGTLQLEAREIRPVGEGELLARIEHLKRMLAAEGVFDPGRKKPLPFLPSAIGLICGRGSAAEHDVVDNARRRWPTVRFEIRRVAVQGSTAVSAIAEALAALDTAPHVDVIVISRGGGSFEDLLAFSNETLVRAVAAARTPVVSAIGHEIDSPLIDFAADARASTPTDAADMIVPDLTAERALVDGARQRARRRITAGVHTARTHLQSITSRPVVSDPRALLTPHRAAVQQARERADRALSTRLRHARADIGHLRATARALSPQATLDRGYAVVRDPTGHVLTDAVDTGLGASLNVTVARGSLRVTVDGIKPAAHEPTPRDASSPPTPPPILPEDPA